jgi:hypothetical protein
LRSILGSALIWLIALTSAKGVIDGGFLRTFGSTQTEGGTLLYQTDLGVVCHTA